MCMYRIHLSVCLFQDATLLDFRFAFAFGFAFAFDFDFDFFCFFSSSDGSFSFSFSFNFSFGFDFGFGAGAGSSIGTGTGSSSIIRCCARSRIVSLNLARTARRCCARCLTVLRMRQRTTCSRWLLLRGIGFLCSFW